MVDNVLFEISDVLFSRVQSSGPEIACRHGLGVRRAIYQGQKVLAENFVIQIFLELLPYLSFRLIPPINPHILQRVERSLVSFFIHLPDTRTSPAYTLRSEIGKYATGDICLIPDANAIISGIVEALNSRVVAVSTQKPRNCGSLMVEDMSEGQTNKKLDVWFVVLHSSRQCQNEVR